MVGSSVDASTVAPARAKVANVDAARIIDVIFLITIESAFHFSEIIISYSQIIYNSPFGEHCQNSHGFFI